MRRVCTLCVLCLSMTAAVAWGSNSISRRAATRSHQVQHNRKASQRNRRHHWKPGPSRYRNATHASAAKTSGLSPVTNRVYVAMAVKAGAANPVLVGDGNVETTQDGGQNASEAFGYTASATGTATTIGVYLDSTDGVQLGLYTDKSGEPGTSLDKGSVTTNKAGWVSVPLSGNAQITRGTRYWIAIAATGSRRTVGYRDQGSSGSGLDYSGNGLANPYSISQHWNSNPASVYVGGTTSAPPPPVAPASTAPPGVTGTAQQGDALTASTGTWTGTAPITYTYQWQQSGTNIANATSSRYTASAGDVGYRLDVVVTATNAAGSTSARSLPTAVVVAPPSPPLNTVLPVVTGTTTQGQTLQDGSGTWTGNPTSFAYQWQDCSGAGNSCTMITGATSSGYLLASSDVGHTIRVVVTATNAGGSTSATSVPTAMIAPLPVSAPSNTVLEVVSGTDTQGQLLSTTNGSWNGSPTSYAYQWQDCATSCTNISGATSSSYMLASSDVGSTMRVVVTATNSSGSAQATSASTGIVAASSSGGLPPGVTLTAIDGGPSYYCSHGFTNACNGGWDNPAFFPVGPWWGSYVASTWSDIGWNTAFRHTGTDMAALNANGVFSLIASNDDTSGGFEDTIEPTTVGLITMDEPSCWSANPCPGGGNGPVTPAIANTPNSVQDGRFWYVNNTWQQFYSSGWGGAPAGTPGGTMANFFDSPITTPNGTTRRQDIQSADEYWFSDVNGPYPTTYEGGLQYLLGHDLTAAQSMCGCRYGDMIDYVPGTTVGLPISNGFERAWQDPTSPIGNASSVPAPIAAFVEDGNVGASASGTITPPQMNWAVWSSIVHGARQLIYFDHSFAGNCWSNDNIEDPCYQVPYSGQSISIYAQVKATDELIKQLASDINSPLANNYVTVQGTPGSLNGPPATFAGIETRATYQGNGAFTIFADTRDAESNNPGAITFHTADNYTGPVTAVCDSRTGGDGHLNPGTCVNRTVTATNGTFTDTFAKGSTVHIYQIP
jgi:hypothetical protein